MSDTEPIFYRDQDGNSYSAYPPETYLTFAYWIYCVPQYKPENVLILGYAGGTIAGLIHKIYGDVPVTGIDLHDCPDHYGDTIIKADAKEFIKTCGKFDAVIVDLFDAQVSNNPCDFVSTVEFVEDLKKVANYIILNTLHIKDLSAYEGLRKMGSGKASGSAEVINYYEVNGPIINLHPWKE